MPDRPIPDDSSDMFMDDRLNFQALRTKRILDQSVLSYEAYAALDKRELLEMLLKSAQLLHEGAEHIAKQRTSLIRFQMAEINRL